MVPGRHQLSILCGSQTANKLLTGNVAGHSGFRERLASNDSQTWAMLLTGMEQPLCCNMDLTQKGNKFLMNLSRNWTIAWPRAIVTAAKLFILGVLFHIREELAGVPPCPVCSQHWAETPPGVPMNSHPRLANAPDYSHYI